MRASDRSSIVEGQSGINELFEQAIIRQWRDRGNSPDPGSSRDVAEALDLALEITNAVISIFPTGGEEQTEIASK
jgi:hypothetical protein